MSSFGGHSAPNKITKQRGKMVKPILKKLSYSHSEKNSLDLDRGWEDQSVEQLGQPGPLGSHGWGDGYGSRSSSARDVSFAIPTGLFAFASDGVGGGSGSGSGSVGSTAAVVVAGAGVVGVGVGVGAGGSNVRTKFQHGRSASQASTGSNSRGGFIHPFQQTPRTSTPPLSYANSLASFDNARDYSPTITENEDDLLDSHNLSNNTTTSATPSANSHHIHHTLPTLSQSNLRRPSLASQRTASFSDITSPAGPLRVNTGRSTPATTSRLAHGSISTASHSDLHLNLALTSLESPITPSGATGSVPAPPPPVVSPTSSAAPMSPLRSSLEAASFPRLRSRSELDTAARAENIRAARRRFEERERAKEEKYDREMIRKRERRDTERAARIEKESRKTSMSDSATRPTASRKTTPTSLSTSSTPVGASTTGKGFWAGGGGGGGASNSSRNDLSLIGRKSMAAEEVGEKQMTFAARKYESVPDGQTAPPAFGPGIGSGVEGVRFETRSRRGSNAKRRTQTYWQGFILWLRTKILRMSGGR
ncbi:hypothetical protein B0H67DRAFT_639919 [Lasiosphaeris hirsuta]|uniref:Uncharacterized protein n=1 Tax=Lasiosphaeris hirsuta TaxID=260670 RepID=A0AA40BC45_9PEZI|nr:hypothetical protein B0H67DRAFT_639919 [Lasiosphaeris hirsuta]